MNQYDLILLLNEEAELEIIKKLVTTSSGKVVDEKKWGKKTLAYPIKKQGAASFFEWKFQMAPNEISEFKKKLNFNEKLLRYLLIKVD